MSLNIHRYCPKHPKYNPANSETGGVYGIKGGCTTCQDLYRLYQIALDMKLPVPFRKAKESK